MLSKPRVGALLLIVLSLPWPAQTVRAESVMTPMLEGALTRPCVAIPNRNRPAVAALSLYPQAQRRSVQIADLPMELESFAALCADALSDTSCTAEWVDGLLELASEAPSSARFLQKIDTMKAICMGGTLLGLALDTTAPAKICAIAGAALAIYQISSCEARADGFEEMAAKISWPLYLDTGLEPIDAIRQAVSSGRLESGEDGMLNAELVARRIALMRAPIR